MQEENTKGRDMPVSQHCPRLLHRLQQCEGVWECLLCGQRWSEPDRQGCCSGIRVYPAHGPGRPAHLKSYDALVRQRLAPKSATRPDGAILRRSARQQTWTYLYDVREAVPRLPDPAIQARIEKATQLKRARYTCQSCGDFRHHYLWYRQIAGGQCAVCRARASQQTEQHERSIHV